MSFIRQALSIFIFSLKHNNMKRLLLLMILLFYGSIVGFSQTKIGISTSGFQSTLSGVRTDLPPSYGFSGFPHTINKTYGFSVAGLM
ncbi:MAG: hypothetical protein ACJAUH_000334 [Saprospiraceae bacterium]|jgi:hypothetical protein